jgi:hypothetical protein
MQPRPGKCLDINGSSSVQGVLALHRSRAPARQLTAPRQHLPPLLCPTHLTLSLSRETGLRGLEYPKRPQDAFLLKYSVVFLLQ